MTITVLTKVLVMFITLKESFFNFISTGDEYEVENFEQECNSLGDNEKELLHTMLSGFLDFFTGSNEQRTRFKHCIAILKQNAYF